MNDTRRLLFAALVVCILIVLVVVLGQSRRPQSSATGADALWLPELKHRLAEVHRLQLRSADGSVSLQRTGGTWTVTERFGYPADFRRLEELLAALAAARPLEQKTARSEHFARLGLQDIENPQSEAVFLEVWGQAEDPLYSVLLGKQAEGRSGRFVRMANEEQTWLIDQNPWTETDPQPWLDSRLLDLEPDSIARLQRRIGASVEFELTRAAGAGTSLAPQNLPEGKRLRYAGVFEAAARAILGAELEDVRPLEEFDFNGEAVLVNELHRFDGLLLSVHSLQREDGNWVKLQFSAASMIAEPAAESVQDTLAVDEKPEAATDQVAAAASQQAIRAKPETIAEIERLNARFNGWAYQVSDYVHGELSKPLDDYLEDDVKQAGNKADE